MKTQKMLAIIFQNVRRNRKHFIFSTVGITVGVSVFSFFIALTFGVREEILNRIYPVDLIEVEPAKVSIGGVMSQVGRIDFNGVGVSQLEEIEGISAVFPKLKSKFQATYKMLFGKDEVRFEAYFDGLDGTLLRTELEKREASKGRTVKSRLHARYGRERKCYAAEDCSPGEDCEEGACKPIAYWSQFSDRGEVIPCQDNSVCVEGSVCFYQACRQSCGADETCADGTVCIEVPCSRSSDCGSGQCTAGKCEHRACLESCQDTSMCSLGTSCVPSGCSSDADCLSGACLSGRCALAQSCQNLRCVQNAKEVEITSNPVLRRGELPGLCEDGTPAPSGSACPPARCPYGTYCSVHTYFEAGALFKDRRGEGFCEQPIPAVLNPMVLELFNLVLGSTMELPQLGSVDALLGYEGSVTYGTSFYKEQVKDRTPVEKRISVVGFSNKALEAGITMPLEYVMRANARYKGRPSTQEYDTIILQLANAEDLPGVMKSMDQANIELSRRSAEADKFRTILQVAIAIFMIMASIILGIAAINISHTFLMVIFERRREIGILRALGATKMDVRAMFLGESVLIGITGGILGNSLAVGMSLVADALARRYLSDFPFEPETFFFFRPEAMALSFGFAVFFSLLGAFFPANRAASMDPAETLTAN